jgi:regulator of replication initiation timing
MALFILAAVSVVCVALLLIERQNIDRLHSHLTSLRQENTALRSQLDDVRHRLVTRQDAAAQSSD